MGIHWPKLIAWAFMLSGASLVAHVLGGIIAVGAILAISGAVLLVTSK